MNIKTNVKKMFKVLVLSSSLIAAGGLQAEDKKECELELRNKLKTPLKSVSCLDEYDKDMTLAEILDAIEVKEEGQCLTPFCNCWLG